MKNIRLSIVSWIRENIARYNRAVLARRSYVAPDGWEKRNDLSVTYLWPKNFGPPQKSC